jgi:hypothetical protein
MGEILHFQLQHRRHQRLLVAINPLCQQRRPLPKPQRIRNRPPPCPPSLHHGRRHHHQRRRRRLLPPPPPALLHAPVRRPLAASSAPSSASTRRPAGRPTTPPTSRFLRLRPGPPGLDRWQRLRLHPHCLPPRRRRRSSLSPSAWRSPATPVKPQTARHPTMRDAADLAGAGASVGGAPPPSPRAGRPPTTCTAAARNLGCAYLDLSPMLAGPAAQGLNTGRIHVGPSTTAPRGAELPSRPPPPAAAVAAAGRGRRRRRRRNLKSDDSTTGPG